MTVGNDIRWIDQVREEHRQLNHLVSEIEAFVAQPRPEMGTKGSHTWASELSSRLVRLHDEFFRHFRFEEEGGMVEELALAHPRAVGEVEEVVEDHKKILAQIREIMTASLVYSEGIEPEDQALRGQVTDLLGFFRSHESHETDLIQRLEYRDSAAAD